MRTTHWTTVILDGMHTRQRGWARSAAGIAAADLYRQCK
jgi:hypothetical protein